MSSIECKSRFSRLLSGLLLVISLPFPLQLLGEEQPAPLAPQPVLLTPQTAPQTPKSDSFDSIEPSRDYLSGKISTFARSIDRFFGGDRHYQESNGSLVQLDLSKLNGYGSDHKIDFGARLNLRLPVTEGQLHLLVESDPEKNINAEPTPGSTVLREKVVAPKSVALATRYATAKEDVWHFSTDLGIKFPIPPTPFVRSRVSYAVPLGSQWRLKAEESVYWFSTLGAGETTRLDLERIISPPLLFRASSNVTWLYDKQNFDMRQDLSIFHTLNDRTALLYQASAIGISNPQFQMKDFVVLLHYRYRLHQEWLFFELSPQLHFPRDRQYQYSPALSMRLEMLFDESR